MGEDGVHAVAEVEDDVVAEQVPGQAEGAQEALHHQVEQPGQRRTREVVPLPVADRHDQAVRRGE